MNDPRHGFRSMASTLLHEQDWNHQAIERHLAHTERNAVSAAYNFAGHLPDRPPSGIPPAFRTGRANIGLHLPEQAEEGKRHTE
jgi:hypothetical protein